MGFTIKPTEQLLRERGLQKGGKVQKFIDSECIRHMDKYTPFQTGFLKRSVILGSVIGSGILRYIASYSRSVYYNNAGRGIFCTKITTLYTKTSRTKFQKGSACNR